VRIVQVPAILVMGSVTGRFVTVPMTLPVTLVSVPEMVPTALITPFTSVKLLVVRVPLKVPTPGITCKIEVTNDPLGGGAADVGSGAVTITVESEISINAMKIARLFRCFILFMSSICKRETPRPEELLASKGHNTREAPGTPSDIASIDPGKKWYLPA
jgi:hypothetical protein